MEDDAMAIDDHYAVEQQPAPAAVSFASSSALILSPSDGMDVSLTSPNPLPAAFDAVSNSNGPARGSGRRTYSMCCSSMRTCRARRQATPRAASRL